MANFETFRTEDELLARIDQLRSQGFSDSELEVISANEFDNDNLRYYGISDRANRDTLDPDYNGIYAYYTGEDLDPTYFGDFGFDRNVSDEALGAVENGNYVLAIERDGFLDDPEYVDTAYDQRKDYIDDDILKRDDLSKLDKIKLHEERLRVNKEKVQTGEIGLKKEVVTETQEIDVPVEKERVTVERHAVEGDAVDGYNFDETADEIRIPIHEEKVSVDKEAYVTEEVDVNTETVTENQKVSDTVRKEKLDVVESGDVKEVDSDEDHL
ncbi:MULTISPECIES: YsnF/AvaK domain-containing protein [Anaerococcus]|uniref:YsnF/AvaK domain-containing protein n=1 Tax=Anaerococcus TaxID=165779 RepID=UPI002354E00B|nr:MULTISPECIES: YsnF/AvaK domain-containing protein [Anaerococcus]MDU3176626.1 YsnF/AvaK domain-containing protein [Anaerococcus sp.]MDU5535256.1 YsnF/AvaK domain-containing protein [Anaerococcus sp.]MDU7412412.1 YsnF/AvaK domain-containing protein [Anaerococcus sp.]